MKRRLTSFSSMLVAMGGVILPAANTLAMDTQEEQARMDNQHAAPRTIHVAPTGNDEYPGTEAEPVRTLARAAATLNPGDTVMLRGGVYRETLRPVRSGAPGRPIVFRAYPGETPVLTGTTPLTDWRTEDDGLWSAPLDWTREAQWQLFLDGTPLPEARWPKAGEDLLAPNRATVKTGGTTTFADDELPGGDEAWTGATLWCAGGSGWIHWSSLVTGYDAESHTITFVPPHYGFYERAARPREGSTYALFGVRAAVDEPGEWYYDVEAGRVFLYPPEGVDPLSVVIAARQRDAVIDLSGRAHIQIDGLHFHAGGIATDEASSDLVLTRLHGRYVGHSWRHEQGSQAGSVQIRGRNVTLSHSDIAIGSGQLVNIDGEDHVIFNNHLHQGNYAANWGALIAVSGRRIHVAYNTCAHSGRDVMRPAGLAESIIEYNDLSHAGYLASDLGVTYGHTTDYENTVFRFNHVHDLRTEGLGKGFYFDHMAINVIVHNNVIWNVGMDPVRFNNPSYFNLVYNNSAWRTGHMRTFDQDGRDALHYSRYANNIFNDYHALPASVHLEGNHVAKNPYTDPEAGDFTLKAPIPGVPIYGVPGADRAEPTVGAVPPGESMWTVGHHFEQPPERPAWDPPRVAWMNLIRNSGFEHGMLKPWEASDINRVMLGDGNRWGSRTNHRGRGSQATGTARGELRFGAGDVWVQQTVDGLTPDAEHMLSAWLRVDDINTTLTLSVTGDDVDASTSTDDTAWTRVEVPFRTGPGTTSVTVKLHKTGGDARADNIGLPWHPPTG